MRIQKDKVLNPKYVKKEYQRYNEERKQIENKMTDLTSTITMTTLSVDELITPIKKLDMFKTS